jgi:hypothetical protein
MKHQTSFSWPQYQSDCLQNCSAVPSICSLFESVSPMFSDAWHAYCDCIPCLARLCVRGILGLAQHYNGSTSTVSTRFGPCGFSLFPMMKITLKRKGWDTGEYGRLAAGHSKTQVLLCYWCTEICMDGCIHFIQSSGLHYDTVTCNCYSLPVINYDPRCVWSALVLTFQ